MVPCVLRMYHLWRVFTAMVAAFDQLLTVNGLSRYLCRSHFVRLMLILQRPGCIQPCGMGVRAQLAYITSYSSMDMVHL